MSQLTRSVERFYAQGVLLNALNSARSALVPLMEARAHGTPHTISPFSLVESMKARIAEGLLLLSPPADSGLPSADYLFASHFTGSYQFPNVNALKRITSICDSSNRRIPIMTSLATLEGEGPEIGKPTLMTRIGGCAVKCKGCDTPFSWSADSEVREFDRSNLMSIDVNSVMDISDIADLIAEQAEAFGLKRISITGGEPLHYIPALRLLVADLWLRGFYVNLETSGVIFDPIIFSMCHVSIDIKTPSSRVVMNDTQIGCLHAVASYLNTSPAHVKAVILDRADFDFVVEHFTDIVKLGQGRYRPLCLTPWAETTLESLDLGRMSSNVKSITEWILTSSNILNSSQVRVVGQQHKTLGFD